MKILNLKKNWNFKRNFFNLKKKLKGVGMIRAEIGLKIEKL